VTAPDGMSSDSDFIIYFQKTAVEGEQAGQGALVCDAAGTCQATFLLDIDASDGPVVAASLAVGAEIISSDEDLPRAPVSAYLRLTVEPL
jgi:hypothetical protein